MNERRETWGYAIGLGLWNALGLVLLTVVAYSLLGAVNC